MKRSALAAILLLTAALGALAQGPADPSPRVDSPAAPSPAGDSRASKKPRWTVLLYYGADCNLEDMILNDVNVIEKALPEKDVEVILLIDRAKGFTKIDGDWTTARTYRLRRGTDMKKFESQLLNDVGELHMGNPDTLERFLGTVLKSFPAEHYALFLSGHGGGWKTCIPDDDGAGERDRKDMTAFEVRDGVHGGLRMAGVEKLDILVFDCCLMAQLEALWICRDVADFIVASEAISYGFPMDECIADFAVPDLTPRDVSRRMVDLFGRYYVKNGKDTGTLSAIDTDHLAAVADHLQALSVKLYPALDEHWAEVARAHFFAETYHGRADYQRGRGATASFDLLDMLRRIRMRMGEHFPAEAEYQDLLAAAKRAIMASWSGARRPGSNGIAVYAPIRWECMRSDYKEAAGVVDWAWPTMLEHLYEMQQIHGRRPGIVQSGVFDGEGRPARSVRPFTGATCRFELKGENILWLLMDFAIRGSDDKVVILYKTFHVAPNMGHDKPSEDLDFMVPDYPDGRSVQAQEIGGLMFGIREGDKIFPTTVEVTDPSDFDNATVQALISHEKIGRGVPVEVSFSTLTWNARSLSLVEEDEDGDRSVRELEKVPEDAVITLLLETDSPREGRATIRSGDIRWGEGPKLAMTAAPEGEQTLFIRAESLAGQSNHHAVEYTLEHDEGLRRALALRADLDDARVQGRWRLQRFDEGEGEFRDLDVTLEIRAPEEKGQDMTFSYVVGVAGFQGLATLDLDGLPLLSLYRKEGPRYRRFESWVLLDASPDALTLHDITESRPGLSRRMRLQRIGGAPASPLDGTWRTDSGLTLVIEGNRYRRFGDGRPPSNGTIEISGQQLEIHPAAGRASQVPYRLEGDALTLGAGTGAATFRRQGGTEGER